MKVKIMIGLFAVALVGNLHSATKKDCSVKAVVQAVLPNLTSDPNYKSIRFKVKQASLESAQSASKDCSYLVDHEGEISTKEAVKFEIGDKIELIYREVSNLTEVNGRYLPKYFISWSYKRKL